MKHISDFLLEDINKFRDVYKKCDAFQKVYYRKYLEKYEWQFKSKKDFFKWFMAIIREV